MPKTNRSPQYNGSRELTHMGGTKKGSSHGKIPIQSTVQMIQELKCGRGGDKEHGDVKKLPFSPFLGQTENISLKCKFPASYRGRNAVHIQELNACPSKCFSPSRIWRTKCSYCRTAYGCDQNRPHNTSLNFTVLTTVCWSSEF